MGRRLNVFCLCQSMLITLITTILVAVAILTDYWEIVQYSSDKVAMITSNTTTAKRVEVLFNGKVIVVSSQERITASDSSSSNNNGSNSSNSSSNTNFEGELLVQMHGGLWWLCFDLTDDEMAELSSLYPNTTASKERCLNQLREQEAHFRSTVARVADSGVFGASRRGGLTPGVIRQIRMQNLAISCSVVCLIILVSCLLVMWVGLIQKQVPPVLVVSVLYVLAAVFAMFSLTITRYRRHQPPHSDPSLDCPPLVPLDALVSPRLLPSRSFVPSWSSHLGWAGVACSLVSAISVYALSKVMRNGPFMLC